MLQHGTPQTTEEPALRYFLVNGKIGVPTLRLYVRTLAGIGLWLLSAPLLARLLVRLGARTALHSLERWWARRMVRYLRIQLEIEGLEHVDPRESYIVTSLHEGFADVLALVHLPLNLRFIARDELYEWRLLGPYLRDTEQINVSPEFGLRGYRSLLRSAKPVFDKGESLVIFPQGTILGIETDFMLGAFALARALNRPILPLAVTGSHRVWEHPFSPRLRYGQRISLRVMPPVPAGQLHERGIEAVRDEVQQQLKAAALDGSMAPPRHFVPARDGYWEAYAYRIDPCFPELAADVAARRAAYKARKS
jgi:1-acyl-sn-glycerol-3-phosphate acyltransferase